MRTLLIFAVALLWIVWVGAASQTLIRPSFVIVIIRNDPEGVVVSDDVTYVGVSRKTGNTIKLKGSTVHTKGADGVTPSRFIGYAFDNEDVSYLIRSGGTLEVWSGEKLLLSESGKWAD